MLDFLKSHTGGATYTPPDPSMDVAQFNTQVRFMINLYFCLSKFVNFYPTFVRSIAAHTVPSAKKLGQQVRQGHEWPPLNEMELLRLQRGLLRYELYCRLVGLPSVAPSRHPDVLRDGAYFKSPFRAPFDRWSENPFWDSLPVDEVEEIICASQYVRDLYRSLRCGLREEFHNHILDLDHGRGQEVFRQDCKDTDSKTARHWMSQDQILDFRSLEIYDPFRWAESMSRLGLVFLDRVTTSTPAERTELMRTGFDNLAGHLEDVFLWLDWGRVVNARYTKVGWSSNVGPRCNPIIQISNCDTWVSGLITSSKLLVGLRRMGWVFFDEAKLRSLGIPHDTKVSTVRDWARETGKNGFGRFPTTSRMPQSVLDAQCTEEEWKQLRKYSLKDRRGDHQAWSRFIAGARAVVDFTSTQLPQID